MSARKRKRTNDKPKKKPQKKRATTAREKKLTDIEARLSAGEQARREWQKMFSRWAKIENGPFSVRVALLKKDPAWAKVTVCYSSRHRCGVSACGRIPLVALIRAGELASELREAGDAGGDPRHTRFIAPPKDE
jgi:hypothetical protein